MTDFLSRRQWLCQVVDVSGNKYALGQPVCVSKSLNKFGWIRSEAIQKS